MSFKIGKIGNCLNFKSLRTLRLISLQKLELSKNKPIILRDIIGLVRQVGLRLDTYNDIVAKV